MTESNRRERPRGQFPLPSPASCPRLPLPLPPPHRAPVQKALHLLGPRPHPDRVPLGPRFPRKSRSCSWGLPGLKHHTTKPIKVFPATVALGKLGDHWINPVCCFLGSGHFWDRPCTSEWDVIPGEAGESGGTGPDGREGSRGHDLPVGAGYHPTVLLECRTLRVARHSGLQPRSWQCGQGVGGGSGGSGEGRETKWLTGTVSENPSCLGDMCPGPENEQFPLEEPPRQRTRTFGASSEELGHLPPGLHCGTGET